MYGIVLNKSVSLCEKSFTAFFKEHYVSFCYFANRFVQDPQEAEDIVSEVAIRIWENKHRLRNPAALKNYFYASIRNASLRALANKEKRRSQQKELLQLLPESTFLCLNISSAQKFSRPLNWPSISSAPNAVRFSPC